MIEGADCIRAKPDKISIERKSVNIEPTTLFKKVFDTTSLKANIAANFIGTGWAALISLLFVPVYLKYIGAEGYGLIGVFASLQAVLYLLDGGLSTTLNKEISRLSVLPDKQKQIRNLVKTLGTVYWIIASAAGLIGLLLSPLLATYWVRPAELSIETVTYAFVLLSLATVFQFPVSFYTGGLLGLQRQVMLNILRVSFVTVRSAGAVLILMFVSRTVEAFFLWMLFVNGLQAVVYKYMVWHYLPKSAERAVFEKEALRKIWRFAAGMTGITFLSILLTQLDKVILSKALSLEQFGYYTVASTLGATIYQISTPLAQSYFPKFSNLISLEDMGGLKKVYHQACQFISVLVMPATFMLAFFSKELILIWAPNTNLAEHVWQITTLYALGVGINGLLNIPYQLTLAYSWTRLGFYQNVILLCIMTPLTIFLALKYGAIGGTLSWLIINVLSFMVTPIVIHRAVLKNELFYWYWDDVIRPLAGGLVIITLARMLIPFETAGRWMNLCILFIIALAAVFGSAVLARDIRSSFRNFIVRLVK